MKKIILMSLIFFIQIITVNAAENKIVNIYFFHSNACSHCKEEAKLLENIQKKYQNVRIKKYEISEEKNKDIINKVEEIYKIEINSVPLTIIGEKCYNGYSPEKTPPKLVTTIKYYSEFGYIDKIGEYIGNVELPEQLESNSQINIDEYIEKNSNYNIILNINSDEIDKNTSSTILGIKSAVNIINIMMLIILIIILKNKMSVKDKIIAYIIYVITAISLEILDYIVKGKMLIAILLILILITNIFMIAFYKNRIKIRNSIKKYILIIEILEIKQVIKNITGISEIKILNKILELNVVSSLEIIINNVIYIFGYMSINIIIILLLNKLLNKNEIVVK